MVALFRRGAMKKANEDLKLVLSFINDKPDARELKRALAVKMHLQNKKQVEIAEMLSTTQSFVSKWVKSYREKGLNGLRLKHKGSTGYLNKEEREQIKNWICDQAHLQVGNLEKYLWQKYKVRYKGKTHYCKLLRSAGYRRKKSQRFNPSRQEEEVQRKRAEIKKNLQNVWKRDSQ